MPNLVKQDEAAWVLVVLAGRLAGEAFRESRFVAGGSVVVDDTLG